MALTGHSSLTQPQLVQIFGTCLIRMNGDKQSHKFGPDTFWISDKLNLVILPAHSNGTFVYIQPWLNTVFQFSFSKSTFFKLKDSVYLLDTQMPGLLCFVSSGLSSFAQWILEDPCWLPWQASPVSLRKLKSKGNKENNLKPLYGYMKM